MSVVGHSLRGRSSGKSSHARCDAERGSQFRTLAATLRAVAPSQMLPSGRSSQCDRVMSHWQRAALQDLPATLDEAQRARSTRL